jgi:serine phosphatase RsbU (regulator of sigma subunit)
MSRGTSPHDRTGGRTALSMKLLMALAFGGLVVLVVVPLSFRSVSQLDQIYGRAALESRELAADHLARLGKLAASNTAIHGRAAFVDNNYSYLKFAMEDLAKSSKDVRFAACVDPQGRTIASGGAVSGQEKLFQTVATRLLTEPMIQVDDEKLGLMVVAAQVKADQELLGGVVIAYDTGEIQGRFRAQEEERRRQNHQAVLSTIVTGGSVLFLGVMMAIGFGLWISRPVSKLAQAATAIASGDFTARAAVAGPAELGQLGATFNEMAVRLRESIDQSIAKASLDRELEVARSLQIRMMPSQVSQHLDGIETCSWYSPAGVCGGDWFSYHQEEGRVLVLVGDVMGHGVPAALVTAAAKIASETALAMFPGVSPSDLLRIIHQATRRAGAGELTMSCLVASIDFRARKVGFAGGGHPRPLIIRQTPGTTASRVSIPTFPGEILGDDQIELQLSECACPFQSNDLIVWFTDGLIEATDHRDRQFGLRRLGQAVLEAASQPVEEVVATVRRHFYDFVGDQPQNDDITVIVGRCH